MKPKEKMWGTWHIISPLSEKVGRTRPPPNYAHGDRGENCNPGKLNAQTWPPLSILLVYSRLLMLRVFGMFSGDIGF